MDLSLQVKILRVLQERSIVRIGGSQKIDIDIRIIAATNKDLRAEVEKGSFREDLYYRINVVPIHIPPLRMRRQDIPPLAQYFLEKYSKENNRKFKGFTPDALEALMSYDWPGNVRELENNIERVVVLHDDTRVNAGFLPRFILSVEKKAPAEAVSWEQDYQKVLPLNLVEQYAIENAIRRCRGDVLSAAKKLGIGQATLYRKIKKYGIKVA
jgi:transcriptional regulator with PAS, ATPase and Fis domain